MAQSAIQTYVQKLYQSVLLRTGESAGVAGWTERAENGLSSMDMVKSFIGSSEAKTIVAVLRLYDIFFDRAADSAGLVSWVKLVQSGASLREVAQGFGQSDEFQSKYGAASTGDFVEALYTNLFERASDAGGKALWIDMIDSGKMSRADVALAFTLSDEAKSTDGAATRFAESYLTLRSAGNAEPSTAAVESLAQKSLADAIQQVQTVTGTVQNGIIQNATVSRDANGDGMPDSTTSTVTTDANGKFTIVGGYGDIVVTGGKDLTTGQTNDKILSTTTNGTSGSEVMVTPLTTIINAMVNQGISTADAVKKVNIALGLDTSIDLLTFNHTSKATASGATQADQKNAVAVKGAVAQLTMLMENTAGLIKGAAGSGTNLDATSITASVVNALADKIVSATANVSTPQSSALVALDSQDIIKEVVNSTATKVSTASTTPLTTTVIDKIANLSTDAAKIISGLNTAVKATVNAINGASTFDSSKVVDAFSTIAKTEALAQDKVQTAITTGAESGSLSSATSSYTGNNLGSEIKSSVIGQIADGVSGTNGGTVIDQVVTPPVSSGGGATVPSPTVTNSTVAANNISLTSGIDKFITKFGVVAVTATASTVKFDIASDAAADKAKDLSIKLAGINGDAAITADVSSATTAAGLATAIETALRAKDGNATDISVDYTGGVLTITDAKGRAFSDASLKDAGTAAVAVAELDSTISISNGSLGVAAVDSYSKLAALDTLTGFAIGTDKIDLLTATDSAVGAPVSLIRVADVATSNDLTAALSVAFASLTPNQAGLVVISAGTAAGTYIYADNGNGNVDINADVFIKLVGVTPGAVGSLNVSDYFI
jgi:hypothetical protein